MTDDLQETLLDAETIRKRVTELGADIDAHYQGEEILLITLLDGAIVFTADLIRNLRRPLRLDCTPPVTVTPLLRNRSTLLGHLRAEVAATAYLSWTTSSTRNTPFTRKISSEAGLPNHVLLDKAERRETPSGRLSASIDHFVIGYGLDTLAATASSLRRHPQARGVRRRILHSPYPYDADQPATANDKRHLMSKPNPIRPPLDASPKVSPLAVGSGPSPSQRPASSPSPPASYYPLPRPAKTSSSP